MLDNEIADNLHATPFGIPRTRARGSDHVVYRLGNTGDVY